LLTSGAEVVCHGAKGGRGRGRWSRRGWGAGSGSCYAPVRELNWRRMGGNRWNGLVVGQGTGRTYYVSHMVLRWAVGFPKTMVVRPALLLFLFYFLNSKRIRVSGFLGNCRIRVSVSFRYRYTYPYPCNLGHKEYKLFIAHSIQICLSHLIMHSRRCISLTNNFFCNIFLESFKFMIFLLVFFNTVLHI